MHQSSLARRAGRAVLAAALVAGPTAVVLGQSAPADAAVNDQAVSGTPSSIWQTNSSVETLATANGVIYAGGRFTRVRPPGTSAGSSQEVARTYLAAFNASTGALITSFNVTLNGQVNTLAVSPDRDTLYVGGSFTTVNGSARGRIAAIDLSSGGLSSWNPNVNRGVTAVTATASRVYLSGDFTTVGGVSEPTIASVYSRTAGDGTPGSLVPTFQTTLLAPPPSMFTLAPSPRALTMLLSPNGQRLLIGGGFNQVNGQTIGGVASIDPTTGELQDWAANAAQPINTNCSGRTRSIVTDGTSAFVTAEGDPPGCYEGTYRADIVTGALRWNAPCLGATQGLTVLNGILYKGSHAHDCAFIPGDARGGYVGGLSRSNFIHYELTGQNVSDGGFVHWTPQTNGGAPTNVGPRVMATDGTQIIVGGDFTNVGGSAQQGITRYRAAGNTATPAVPGRNRMGDPFGTATPVLAGNYAVTVTPTRANTLTVQVPAVEDADNGTLTYRIYRDNGSTPVSTQTVESYPWSRPVIRFDDAGLAAGSTHSYRVTASDGTLTSARSTAVSGTVRTQAPASFANATAGLSPQLWWRLDGSGSAADSSGQGHSGTLRGGVTTGVPGAISGNGAVTLNGSTGYVGSDNQIAAPGAFSQSAWFRTTSVSGGVILAQSDTQTGAGGNTDRMITMDNNGSLVFGVKGNVAGGPFGPATISVRNQGVTWNDGRWHQVVGTYDGNGTLALYVDGRLQLSQLGSIDNPDLRAAGMASSYVRAGYADLSGIQLVFGINFYNQKWPASEFFGGSIDEATAWNYALSAAQVQSLFGSGVGGQ